VNAPVFGVVAPTVPLILIEAVPVKLVTVPLDGVPRAPPERRTAVPSTVIAPGPERAMVVSDAAPSSTVPAVKLFDVPRERGTFEVKSPVECVSVALPFAQLMTPPVARKRSENSPVVATPSVAPSFELGVILVVIVGVVSAGEVENTKLVDVVPVVPPAEVK
jgi:hypothetical protein